VNDDPLTAEIGSGVWGTPANFNEFRVLPSLLLHRRRATEVNHTLHDLWPSPGLVHYIYIFGGSCLLIGILSGCVQILRYPILAALLHGSRAVASAKLCGVVSSRDRAAIPFDIVRWNCMSSIINFSCALG